MTGNLTGDQRSRRRGLLAWCLFDWANSAFPAVIVTFLFAAYVSEAVAPDTTTGTASWGQAQSLAGLAVALLSPLLGAVADRSGRRKPWLAVFSFGCILATAGLWFVHPDPGDLVFALTLVALATLCFELGQVFYNAMLVDLAPAATLGRWSGWGWGLGYGGGVICLLVALFGFVLPAGGDATRAGWLALPTAEAQHVRGTVLLVAAWFLIFALPLFLITPDRPSRGVKPMIAARQGMRVLFHSLGHLRRDRNLLWFLAAHMLYHDGLTTLFAFGGIYAAGSFGMDLPQVMLFGIALNVGAGVGAVLFAFMDDRLGARPTILVALSFLMAVGLALLLVRDVTAFWALGLALSVFLGPVQAASRSLMGRLAPPAVRAELFGLLALSGRATAFLGPAVVAVLTTLFASQRAGMAAILLFFAAGFLCLLRVREDRLFTVPVLGAPSDGNAASR